MYTVTPKGINTRFSERDVPDGFLQESINLQWRDGALRPIPNRVLSGIDDSIGKDEIIFHKVSDEDKVNVLMFDSGVLAWYGTIINGVYSAKVTPVIITGFPTITNFSALSFTILNGLLYFMSDKQNFYYRIQFSEPDEAYEVKDMYAWKDLIPYYPYQTAPGITYPANVFGTNQSPTISRVGLISIRFALQLKTGDIVMHSPMYSFYIYSLYDGTNDNGSPLENIHTFINLNMEYENMSVFDDNVSGINVYASIPFYKTLQVSELGFPLVYGDDVKRIAQEQVENPFFLIKTIEKPTTDRLFLYVGDFNAGITYPVTVTKIDMSTIAAGEVMPVDNFSYHRVFGRIASYNGRLIIEKPKTAMTKGYIRSLCYLDGDSEIGFEATTEDGVVKGVSYTIDKYVEQISTETYYRGLLSYPDSRATLAGSTNDDPDANLRMFKTRSNSAHNMAIVLNFKNLTTPDETISVVGTSFDEMVITLNHTYSVGFVYGNGDVEYSRDPKTVLPYYVSDNRIQFSAYGEFSVWPAANSYRVGDGKIMFAGINSIDPSNVDFMAPLIIGTTDGLYTVNFDSTGNTLVQSITQTAKIPAISQENIQIDQNLIYVSDKGLIAVNSGRIINLTQDYFPDMGGNVILGESVYPNYDAIAGAYGGVDYKMTDIVGYLKDCVFAFDGRRDNLWCSNPSYDYSMVFNLKEKQWGMSTYVFSKAISFYGVINTVVGDVYSRYMTLRPNGVLDVLSGELPGTVEILLLTRAIKMKSPEVFKKIERLIARCDIRRSGGDSLFSLGAWGKQELNSLKQSIPLVAILESSRDFAFPNGVREDIVIGRQKGKYKVITILQRARCSPESTFSGFDIVAIPVDNKIIR